MQKPKLRIRPTAIKISNQILTLFTINIVRYFGQVVSEEFHTEEGIPSPLSQSLLVAFYDTQRIRWHYSLSYAPHHRALELWKTGEDGLCCSSSAIQTRLGPSSLLEERNDIPHCFVVLLCCWLPLKLGETAKVYR